MPTLAWACRAPGGKDALTCHPWDLCRVSSHAHASVGMAPDTRHPASMAVKIQLFSRLVAHGPAEPSRRPIRRTPRRLTTIARFARDTCATFYRPYRGEGRPTPPLSSAQVLAYFGCGRCRLVYTPRGASINTTYTCPGP